MQAHGLSPVDVMQALDRFNIFIPAGDAKFGLFDYALDSNAMYDTVDRMGDVPIKTDADGRTIFLKEVATPEDAAAIQTNVVRVDGRRQVYVPVYRQSGYSTLNVVDTLRGNLPDMKERLTTPDVDLKIVMDQSVYVRKAIESLAEEGALGAILCSLVILVFLGEWRMTAIAVLTIPVAILGAIACLYGMDQTVNVMTLAGLALAIGPLVDSAIICLENTHRHLGLGAEPEEAAFLGASEVATARNSSATPLHAAWCCCRWPLMPGLGNVPVPPDVPGGGVRDDDRLPPLADVRPVPVCRLAAVSRTQTGRVAQFRLRAPQRTREPPLEELARSRLRAVGSNPQRRNRPFTVRVGWSGHSGAWVA